MNDQPIGTPATEQTRFFEFAEGYRLCISEAGQWVESRWIPRHHCLGQQWRHVKPHKSKDGYVCVGIRVSKKRVRRKLHQLVAEAILGPCPEGLEVRHLNGRPDDNRPGNLRYGSRVENMQDRLLHGTHSRGERCGMAKLSEADIAEIRRLCALPGTVRLDVASRFSISSGMVSKIAKRQRWGHLPDSPETWMTPTAREAHGARGDA